MKTNKTLLCALFFNMIFMGCEKTENILPQTVTKIPVPLKEVAYTHTYFTVMKPPAYSAKKEDNGVYFTSPDGKIHFYAYGVEGEGTPIPKGQKVGYAPSLFEKQKTEEMLLSQRTVEKENPTGYGYVASRYSTYGSTISNHYRSFIAKRECHYGFGDYGDGASRCKCRYYTIGVIYPNKNIFEQYKDVFMHFKDSFQFKKKKG